MEHRLGRTLRVFLVVLAAAGFYRLTVVPLVEPRFGYSVSGRDLSDEGTAVAKSRADRHMTSLKEMFPAGSWELDDPTVLESRQMRLLFKDYWRMSDREDERRVQLYPCTLVILPSEQGIEEGKPPGRTLLLRAPQGAVLEFDEPFDLRGGRLAKLVGGSLRGQVTIRGTPSAPGLDDEVEIITRDVELEEMEIRTSEAVQFRYGRSSGSGRAMVARLLPGDGNGDKGPNIGGIDTIRLDRDVKMRLEGLTGGLIPGSDGAAPVPGDPAAAVGSGEEPVPVLVSCRGSLCMNVSANVISLEDHVDVVRTLPGGGHDQLACDLLAIVLGRDAKAGAAGGLKPLEIQAKGTPVVARSSAAGLEARAMRLGYEIASRRILLDGDEPVSLVVEGTEMEARSIDYTPGPKGDPGSLMAVGPGWLRSRGADTPPVMARWQKWLRLRGEGTGHVASLSGEADVHVEGQGRLTAGELHLWLDLVPQEQALPVRPRGPAGLAGVKPSRMLARSMVEIAVQQLTARTDRLEIWFRHESTAPLPVAVAGALPVATQPAALQSAALQPAAPAAAIASPAPTAAATPGTAPQAATPSSRLLASGGLMRGLVIVTPQGQQLEELSLEGQVKLIEEPETPVRALGQPQPEAIEIHGDQLQLSRPTRFDARAVVSGRPATVAGRGVDLQGPLIEFDRGRNRLSVDGAGRLKLPLAGGMPGFEGLMVGSATPPAPAPLPVAPPVAGALDVGWQGRMDFDGLTARFVDRVVTTSGGSSLRAGSLDVVLNRQIDFTANPGDRSPQGIDVVRIGCGGGVRVESESVSAEGQRAVEKLFVRDLMIDRVSGDVSGNGPGRLASTRYGAPPGFAVPAAGQGGLGASNSPAQQPPPTPRADQLTYLGVDFQRGVRGNLHSRVMEFQQRVEAIFGPVADWPDSLDTHAAGGLPQGAVAITSDVLSVGQTPPAPGQHRNSIEIGAGGNVMVEGEGFTARSARLTWSESKDLIVFEGDGRSDAQLFRQERVGAPTSSASAGKILYWRGLNQVDVNDARYLDFDQLGGAGTPGLPGLGVPKPAPPQAVPVKAPRNRPGL